MILKIISVLLLLLMPINANGDTSISDASGMPINPQTSDPNYWPPKIAELQTLYAQNPQNTQVASALANAYNNYGVLLAQNKQWSDAQSYLQQAISISPNPEPIRKNLSNIYYEQGLEMYKDRSGAYSTYTAHNAEQIAQQAIALNPQNANAYLLLGDVNYMEQNMPAAQHAWEQAAQLLPDNQQIQQRLAQINRETTTERDMNSIFNPYFNIKVDASVAGNTNFSASQVLDYAHDTVAPDFMFRQNFKVPVVVYNKQEYQQTMVDAPGWAEAIYDGKIRLAIGADQTDFKQLQSDVVHEYTHVIVGALTNNNCPRWFNEGLAKYEEYKHGNPPRIYLLAMAYNANELIDWDKINSAIVSANSQEALLAYQQAFSFIYYIVQRYGMSKITTILKSLGNKTDFPTAIQDAYGKPLETIQKDWRQWLGDFLNNWAEQPADQGVGYR